MEAKEMTVPLFNWAEAKEAEQSREHRAFAARVRRERPFQPCCSEHFPNGRKLGDGCPEGYPDCRYYLGPNPIPPGTPIPPYHKDRDGNPVDSEGNLL
jgi:hypothetical protein